MPHTSAFKVQGASTKTRWTLARDSPLQSPEAVEADKMQQSNGYGFERHDQPLPQYENYDGSQSQYSTRTSERLSTYRPPEPVNGGSFDAFDFNQATQERAPRPISVNTRVRSFHHQDAVSQHLLYETALMDSQTFEVLDIVEVDALKKEHVRLNSRTEAAQRKLTLESKVRNAAQNLQRLYSARNRPDTPQSPESPKKGRSSLLPRPQSSSRASSGPEALLQADGELASSVKKVDELHDQIKSLLDRRQYVERKLLRHTAAVLAEEANKNAESAVPGLVNGHHGNRLDDEDEDGDYTPNEFDGIRDILQGRPVGASNKTQQYEEQMSSVQDRLEQLNYQLRNVISEAGQTLGKPPPAEVGLDQSEEFSERLENRFARLEHNLHALAQQQHDITTHYGRMQGSQLMAVEEHLEGVNSQLHHVLLTASETQPVPDLQQPPQATGQGYQDQLQYLEESLMTMEQLIQQHSQALQSARDSSDGASKAVEDAQAEAAAHAQKARDAHDKASRSIEEAQAEAATHAQKAADAHEEASRSIEETRSKAAAHAQKAGEYETVLGGLWDILQSDAPSPRPNLYEDDEDEPMRSPQTPLRESFSLQAFSTRVQHLFDRAQSAKEQQDILRRQIQQQRELSGKSDGEKDRQLTELQGKHYELSNEHGAVQQELANVIVRHRDAESQTNQSRSELLDVMMEVENLKRTVDTKQQERDEMARQTNSLQDQIEHLEAQLADLIEGEDKRANMQTEMENLESEVVRLTTELTMAKAELDGAYGNRAERAGAQAAEVRSLNEKNKEMVDELEKLRGNHETLLAEADSVRGSARSSEHAAQLERELQEMTNEFQDLTKESIELEKEREQLDTLIDSLRDRCDTLEVQLSDEKVRWMGIKSPTGAAQDAQGIARETTTTMVLRQEFKKMMREQRAEGIRLLRVR